MLGPGKTGVLPWRRGCVLFGVEELVELVEVFIGEGIPGNCIVFRYMISNLETKLRSASILHRIASL